MSPLIIEAAINGATSKARNPNTPKTPAEIAVDALACLAAGAAIVHNHIADYQSQGDDAVKAYAQGWAPILAQRPDAILCGTVAGGRTFDERFGHYAGLAAAGARMGVLDPGSVNLGSHGPDGLPGAGSFVYRTSFEDIAGLVGLLAGTRQGPSIAIYEPGFLRTTLAYEKAGKLPAGAMVKFYFAGPYNFLDGQKSDVTFGLPPTQKALEAYLEMLQGSSLPWTAAVIGGSLAATGMARLAIERGGHVRVGLEDYGGEDKPANAGLVAEVAAIASACGRAVATSAEAARILGLPA